MDKLIDVSRTGGFPWCAETAGVLNENTRYIEAIMDGFNIGYRQAIILSGDMPNMSMYIKEYGQNTGKLVKVFSLIPNLTRVNLLNNLKQYQLIDRSTKTDINKPNSEVEKYSQCILHEAYEIVAASQNISWTFLEMKSFFEMEKAKEAEIVDIMLYDSVITDTGYDAYALIPSDCIDIGGLFRLDKFKKRADINMEIGYTGYFKMNNIKVKLPDATKQVGYPMRNCPLSAIIEYLGNSNLIARKIIPAYIAKDGYSMSIYLHLQTTDYYVVLNGVTQHTHIYISGSMLLETYYG